MSGDAFPKTKEQWAAAILLLAAGTGVGGYVRPAIDAVALESRLTRAEISATANGDSLESIEHIVTERGEILARIEASTAENTQRLARLEAKIDQMTAQARARIGD